MPDDAIDKMLQREDANTARVKGTLDEARQSTADMARPEERPQGGIVNRVLRMPPSTRSQRQDRRD